jgi:nucleotide-binding universal stress UspA family protein
MIEKILFPIDGSENSQKAFNHVVEIAKNFASTVVIIHAYELPSEISIIGGRYGNTYASLLNDVEQNLLTHGQFIIKEAKEQIKDQGLNAETLLVRGAAGPAIVRAISTENCEMVIMSSKGTGALERFLVGSVSDYVIHHTKAPVLLVH